MLLLEERLHSIAMYSGMPAWKCTICCDPQCRLRFCTRVAAMRLAVFWAHGFACLSQGKPAKRSARRALQYFAHCFFLMPADSMETLNASEHVVIGQPGCNHVFCREVFMSNGSPTLLVYYDRLLNTPTKFT